MNTKETRRYEMLLRVRDFGKTYGQRFSGSSAAQTAFATVAAAIDELTALGVVKLSAQATGRADAKRTARRALAALLASVSRLARVLRAEGQTLPPFSRPRSRSDQALLTTARKFAQDVEPFAEEFCGHELRPERIAQAIAAFEAALRHRGNGSCALTASRARIRELLTRAQLAVRRLDLIIANRPASDPTIQVVWKQARRVEDRRRRRPRSERDRHPLPTVQILPPADVPQLTAHGLRPGPTQAVLALIERPAKGTFAL